MGVWIETKGGLGLYNTESSLLMWECGLKHSFICGYEVGSVVTPYVGVWIETSMDGTRAFEQLSLLMWECGLKHYGNVRISVGNRSLLMWECGLKPER